MRKVFWCFTSAGVLMAGVLSSASYYACAHPETMIGHCLNTVASASVAMQPMTVLASRVAKATRHAMSPEETTTTAGSSEECVPDDPKPIAPEFISGLTRAGDHEVPAQEMEQGPAPIVINEDEPIQRVEEAEAPPSTIELNEGQAEEVPESACPMVMPYCTDDDEPLPTPNMPYADGAAKHADGSEASEDGAFKAWTKLLQKPRQESKPESSEELPPPAEEAQEEPTKCQEDSHLHEHYSGCPHMTCPYTGKTYPSCEPATKSGKEEVSEEPETQPKKHGKKHSGKSKECPHTEGVDTMEYRPSDGGLNEFGPGPF